ncbi:putative nuclease HARBI1 [Notolabrus celidotus]|uniref:putative nuclease HARBI1 n=1 Tax=Notolabrus celidotus TaxID=1203425 RepID=UPI00148FD5AE|nr:putative nuclease HARBI1 [Notolabrus celidotus]
MSAVLKVYELVPETYCQRFRSWESHIAVYISEHKVSTAAEGTALADNYVLTHRGDRDFRGQQVELGEPCWLEDPGFSAFVSDGSVSLPGEVYPDCAVTRAMSRAKGEPDSPALFSSRIFSRFYPLIHSFACTSRALNPSSVPQILCVALRFFANGSFLYDVGDAEHLSKATVCRTVRKVCLALKRLLNTFIVIKEEFHRIAGFPSVIGCIDGTQIPITAPSHHEADYVNRKSIHSINVQIICDAAYIISNVEAKWPGSVHDSRMHHESNLSNRLQRGEFDGLLLGDRGYPCQPRLLTPYPDPEPGPQQNFNRAHCRTRARVEMTTGLLKARFQCLRHLRVTPERACDIIVACVVLHNIATLRGEQHPALQIGADDDHPIHLPAMQDGRAVRDTISRIHFRD